MIQTKIEIVGYQEIIKQFSALDDRIRKKVFVKVLKNNTRVLENRMKTLCPVRKTGGFSKKYPSRNHPPGYLRASIGTVVGRGLDYPTIWVKPRIRGKWDTWYKHYLMAGTEKIETPNPFVDKAWEEIGPTVKSGLLTDLGRQIQSEINKLK